ncbi:MAG: hypothetical protein WBO73_20845 [Gammaproteobacteria bacterium]
MASSHIGSVGCAVRTIMQQFEAMRGAHGAPYGRQSSHINVIPNTYSNGLL